jgi:serine/threonine-protein kinase
MLPFSSVSERSERIVGNYRLRRRLGSGAMGEVWLGQHVVTGGTGAVKILRESTRGKDRVQRFFAREGRAIARMHHPHIVAVFEVAPDHLVTAYIDGSDLARRLHTPIDPATAVRIVLQIASALAHAHAHGVVHRDVKPSNIMLDRHGNAYLADFGLALIPDDAGGPDAGVNVRAGTPAYMAPEQMKDGVHGPAVDQYALGRTLLEMLLGTRVPPNNAEALAQLSGELPEPLVAAVRRATAAEPGARFPSVWAFGEALARLDLSAYPPPERVAAEVRLRGPFGWCAGAHAREQLAPDLMRCDYRLSELAAAGLLPAGRVADLLAMSGLAEMGWSVYGRSARLGPIDDAAAYARAAEVIVLMHGWAVTRAVWSRVAAALCRDNAQAIVLVPDVFGHGETRFARKTPPREVATMQAQAEAVRQWIDVVGLRDFPTVMVGHSMSAVGLLCMGDEDVGPRVSRVAINPVWPMYDVEYRRRLQLGVVLGHTLARVPGARQWLLAKMVREAPAARELAHDERERMVANVLAMGRGVVNRIVGSFRAAPLPGKRHDRLMLLIGVNDPLCKPEITTKAMQDLGIRPEQLRLLATGGHYPHMEAEAHPEWTARNCDEIVQLVNTMLLSAREGTLSSTELESTFLCDTASTQPAHNTGQTTR